jgi:hypothetical protein
MTPLGLPGPDAARMFEESCRRAGWSVSQSIVARGTHWFLPKLPAPPLTVSGGRLLYGYPPGLSRNGLRLFAAIQGLDIVRGHPELEARSLVHAARAGLVVNYDMDDAEIERLVPECDVRTASALWRANIAVVDAWIRPTSRRLLSLDGSPIGN